MLLSHNRKPVFDLNTSSDLVESPTMEAIDKRLTSLRSTIEEMMALTGTAGLTYGVIYRGDIVHTENFGFRDVEEKLPVNEDTIFQIASLTKSMVAAGIGMLVEEKKMDWNTPLKELLPEWHVEDPVIRNTVTIVDCLAHRTGLQMNNYWLQSNNNIIIPLKDSMTFLNGLVPVRPFRGQYQYNNLGYEVARHLIKKLSGMTWDQILHLKLFEPLQMLRTGTHQNFSGPDNVSKAYGALSNGTPIRIGDAQIGDDTVAGAAGGVRSCLNDMLKLMKAWLVAADQQFINDSTSTAGSPLKQINYIMSAQIPTGAPSHHETSYAMGWARTELPGPMGVIGLNNPWRQGPAGSLNGMPLVGKSTAPQLVVYHQGANLGVLAAAILLPESQSAIVVLSNTLALNDCADWVGQLLLESLLDVQDKNDYLQITKDTVAQALAWYPAMSKELRENRDLEFPRNRQDYVGVYYNNVGTVHIDVTPDGQQLRIAFQGLEDEIWNLRPWEGNTFTWLPESRDVIASRGRFTCQSPDYYKIKFGISHLGHVKRLIWVHEGWNIPEREGFLRINHQKGEQTTRIVYRASSPDLRPGPTLDLDELWDL